jgi:hypothetical protein
VVWAAAVAASAEIMHRRSSLLHVFILSSPIFSIRTCFNSLRTDGLMRAGGRLEWADQLRRAERAL